MQTLDNKVIMITGASSGFGATTARRLVKEGAKVVLGARREHLLKSICEELGSQSTTYNVCDVTKKKDVIELFNKGITKFSKIDALINNAGVAYLSHLNQGATDEWETMIDVNIKGVLYGIHSVLDHMLKRGYGQIINICSMAGHQVGPAQTVYCATKHAVRAISDGLRLETKGKIQVTNISPGLFSTEIFNNATKDSHLSEMIQTVLPMAESPEHVASAILFALKQSRDISVDELIIKPLKI